MKILLRLSLNSLIANPEKFQFMILLKFLQSKYCLKIGPINVKESDYAELLGITIDKHLDFKKHIEDLCWNACSQTYEKKSSCRKSKTAR